MVRPFLLSDATICHASTSSEAEPMSGVNEGGGSHNSVGEEQDQEMAAEEQLMTDHERLLDAGKRSRGEFALLHNANYFDSY